MPLLAILQGYKVIVDHPRLVTGAGFLVAQAVVENMPQGYQGRPEYGAELFALLPQEVMTKQRHQHQNRNTGQTNLQYRGVAVLSAPHGQCKQARGYHGDEQVKVKTLLPKYGARQRRQHHHRDGQQQAMGGTKQGQANSGLVDAGRI